jgi:hypothetical protein
VFEVGDQILECKDRFECNNEDARLFEDARILKGFNAMVEIEVC